MAIVIPPALLSDVAGVTSTRRLLLYLLLHYCRSNAFHVAVDGMEAELTRMDVSIGVLMIHQKTSVVSMISQHLVAKHTQFRPR